MTRQRTLPNWYIALRIIIAIVGLIAVFADRALVPWIFGLYAAMWLVPFALGFRKDTQP